MYGAILGDMIGAPYEFDRGQKTKDFPLFTDDSRYTDDTVMTIAVADALLRVTADALDGVIRDDLISSLHRWGRAYPNAGYGGRFRQWLRTGSRESYGSYGNGSAMRVSAAGWLYDDLETTRRIARLTAEITHNHSEGIKGAEATASAIFLARTGSSKEEIKGYIIQEFGYDLSRTCDEIRPSYHHVESCQETVPEAITAFLEGNDFEDVIRTAVSLGGDCDTLTCIAGGIAEAFYGVPALLEAECKSRLPEEMCEVLERFDSARGRSNDFHNTFLDGNDLIEDAIAKYYAGQSRESLIAVLEAIRQRMHQDGHFLIPVIPPQAAIDMIDIEHVRVGDTVTNEEELHFKLHHIETNDGQQWLVAFTSQNEYEKGESASIISNFIDWMLKSFKDMSEAGIIINPWGQSFMLTKELINLILDADKPENHIYFEIGDITKMKVDAIVNAARPSLLGGGGVDGAIHKAAGIGLTNECRELGGCKTGEAKITGGWLLPAKYVIHTVGPRYESGNPMCERYLHACYWNSLDVAKEHDLHTIAFPAISTGAYGYPKQEAAAVALKAVSGWLTANPDYGMAVIMVCRDSEMRQYYQNVIDACAPGKE